MNQQQRKNLRERVRKVLRDVNVRTAAFLPDVDPEALKEIKRLRRELDAKRKEIQRAEKRAYAPIRRVCDRVSKRGKELQTAIIFEDDAQAMHKAVTRFEKAGI